MKISINMVQQFFLALLVFFLGVASQQEWDIAGHIARAITDTPSAISGPKVGAMTSVGSTSVKDDPDFEQFWEIWQLMKSKHVNADKLTEEQMMEGVLSGLAGSADDPYTFYLSPKENEEAKQDLAGYFYGVGIELGYVDGILSVMAPIEGSPAEKAGLKPGDLIVRVKDTAKNVDEDSSRWSLSKAVETIRGPKGSTVTLQIFRPNSDKKEAFDVDLVRDEIVVVSVKLEYLQTAKGQVAHLQLKKFGDRTPAEWDAAVNDIRSKKAQLAGIVLDMRNNSGGYLDGAIYISSEFISDGVVVTEKNRDGEQPFEAQGKGRLVGMPTVVLVNKGSASAAEIVAGALRDRLQVKLVGEKTFGKGTVQNQEKLSNGGSLRLTVAQWLLPGGEWIHEEGIPVTIEVKDDDATEADEQLDKALETL